MNQEEGKQVTDPTNEYKDKIAVNQEADNVGLQKSYCPPTSVQVASGLSLSSNETEDLSQSPGKNGYLTNVPVKLTLEKDKKSIDSMILPSAESASSETYENSIKAFNRVVKKKKYKKSIRDVIEPSKVSTEEALMKALKSQDEEYFEGREEDAYLEAQMLSQSLQLIQAVKAILNKDKQVKENLDTGVKTVYTFRHTIVSKIDQWKMTTEMNTEFESNCNLD